MRKRLFLSVGAMTLIGCAALVVLAMFPPRPGVTKANFDRIEVGMTFEATQQILGEVTRDTDFGNGTRLAVWLADGDRPADWAHVIFDEGKVTSKDWSWSNETTLHRFRRWLRV